MSIFAALTPTGRRLRDVQAEIDLAERERELAAIRNQKAVLDAQSVVVSEASNIFNQDDSGTLFDLYNYTTGDAMDDSDHLEMQRKAYQAWATDGFARGWIETFVKFVVGRQCRLTAADENAQTQELLDNWCAGIEWPDGHREKPWSNRAEEWVRRTFRDGETFTRVFVNEANGDTYLRFLCPIWVRNPLGAGSEEFTFGVKCMANDIERPLQYAYWPNGFTYWRERRGNVVPIDASEIIHSKISDSDAKRGRPLLMPVISDLVEFNKLLRSRRKLHWLRTLFAVEKTIKGNWPEMMRAMHSKQKTTVGNDATGTREVAPREGSIWAHGENTSVEFKTPNLQAIDADADIRRQGLKILVGLGLTETVGLGDASNNNYSSGELAESPMVTTMRFWQGFFEADFKEIGRRVVQAAKNAGELPASASSAVNVGFPILNPRDIEKETRALALQNEMGWVSRRTAQIKLDLNPEAEEIQLEREHEEEKEEMAELEIDLNGTQSEIKRLVNNGSPGNNGNGEASSARRTSQLRRVAATR